ncbi:DUF6880 family protein [Roseibium salinum]|nr:DUF6880 family protein [Roseibium sp. DSM 29163]
MTSEWAGMRQSIAAARGDLDLLVALEAEKRQHMQDSLGIAAQLLEIGRAAEALDWVRKPGQRGRRDMSPVIRRCRVPPRRCEFKSLQRRLASGSHAVFQRKEHLIERKLKRGYTRK